MANSVPSIRLLLSVPLFLFTDSSKISDVLGHSHAVLFSLTDLTLEAPNKNCSRRHFNCLLYLSKKIGLDFSCESSASLVTSSLIFSEKQ